MGVCMTDGLEPAGYWQDVCALANDLLTESPLRDWSVVVSSEPKVGADGDAAVVEWGCRLDRDAKELAVNVPPDAHDPDETDPEDVATYIVFDLLLERVMAEGGAPKGN